MATPTTIYLSTKQRKGYFKRARRRSTSFSKEVRDALDFYLEFPPDFDPAALQVLLREANASMDRSVARLDDAIAFCKKTMRRIDEHERG